MSRLKNKLINKILEFQEKIEDLENNLSLNEQIWTEPLEDLAVIEKSFEADKLTGKTILDIGTDCVKPLYIALKYEPKTIIGINDDSDLYPIDIEQKSKLYVKTRIKFYDCNFFYKVKLKEILCREKLTSFDFVLLSKTMHHLRSGECIAKERDPKHCCQEDEEDCIYKFDEQKIFERLLNLGKKVIVYECFFPGEDDDDKVRGRGGYFTINEWKRILCFLTKNYKVKMIQPLKCSINKEEFKNVISKLRQVDCICFYVEMNGKK